MRFAILAALAAATVPLQSASAHYPWVKVSGETANFYFEEGPAPGDGTYLDPFIKRGRMWVHTAAASEPAVVKMHEIKKGKTRWLNATVTKELPRSVDFYGLFGTYRYGKTDVLLHYYARHIAVKSRDQLPSLAKAPHLIFTLVPRIESGRAVFRAVYRGKPATGKRVIVQGPGIRQDLTTDKNGEFRLKTVKPGTYRLRAYLVEAEKSGKFEGKAYEQTRHHSTLLLTLP